MGSIGSYKYPDISVPEAYKTAKIIYDFSGQSMSVQLLAEKLNISARGGWTGMILFSLKRYGLAEGRGLLHTTDLAEKLVNPLTPQELQATKETIFNKIELWVRIRKDYGTKALSGEFCSYLVDKLHVDRQIAQSKYEKVAKLYTESVAFCFPSTSSESNYEDDRRTEQDMEERPANLSSSFQVRQPSQPSGVVSYGSSDEYNIWVKKDIIAIEFVESQLEAIKAWLKLQKTKLQTEKVS